MHLFSEADVLSLMGLDIEALKSESEIVDRLGTEFSSVCDLLQKLHEKVEL